MSEALEIPLTRGMVALVDPADFDELTQWKWCALNASGERFYAYRVSKRGGVQKSHLMHRQILGAGNGVYIDHLNRNSLDNRRSNLRACSQAQNCLNRVGYKKSKTSRFKGVWWQRPNEKWCASFRHKYLGIFLDEEAAARAYDAAALAYSPEFALLNFKEENAPCQA